jgi:rieske iron-sulfur protein
MSSVRPVAPAADPSSANGRPPRGGAESTRRRVLKWAIGGAAAAFAAALALPALAIRSLTQQTKDAAPGDLLVYAPGSVGAEVGQPLTLETLAVGSAAQVFPDGKADNPNNLIEVVRLAEGPDGLVAYSAICTHLGCAVYAALNQEGLIACPCHASLFDPRDAAAVVAGPAGRPLPAIPVRAEADGTVQVAGAFAGPIGPA